MAHWHWRWTNSAFYKWIQVIQDLVKLFDWVIDIKLTFFNLREWTLTTKEILKFDLSKVRSTEDCFRYMGTDDINVTDDNHLVHTTWYWSYSSCEWNFEITSIQNAANRLYKQKWEKILIVVWDWQMRTDSFDTSDLIDGNYYICWQSLKKYNPYTAKEVCQHIEKNWVHLFWFWIWMSLKYIRRNEMIKKWWEVYEKIFNFLKESLK